jgi:hypothetical protein
MPRARALTACAAAALGLVVGTGACVPADSRPTLGTSPAESLSREPTGIPDVDRLLARLDEVSGETFTADYTITRKLGPVERAARVVSQPPRTTVRVGDIALYDDDNPDQTCDLVAGTCEDGLLDQRISDVGVGSRFYGPSTAQQLRVAVARESSPPTVDSTQVAGIGAECLHVSVGGGIETYCVTGNGLVAMLDTAAIHIELTSLTAEADPSAFDRPQASTTTS